MVQPAGNFFAYPAAAQLIGLEAGAPPPKKETKNTKKDLKME